MKNKIKKIAILGLPNTGKSQIFNNLTGQYTLVANYPFTTIEIKRAICNIKGNQYEVLDTPGLHCLYIHSEEEIMVRDMLFSEQPDIIIQCIDANRLKQSLTLTADLLELNIPMIISLNAIDETSKQGMKIDTKSLRNILGVSIVESVAIKGIGTEELKQAILAPKAGTPKVSYGDIIEKGILTIQEKLPEDIPYKRKAAILILLNDKFWIKYLNNNYSKDIIETLKNEAYKINRQLRGNISYIINNRRNVWINKTIAATVKKEGTMPAGFAQTFAKMSRHPFYGIPILLFFLTVTFYLIIFVAGTIEKWMNVIIVVPVINLISYIIPNGFWYDFLIGHYGILTLGLFNAIVTVLPILSVFFLMFSFLEDIGYIPNLCVLVKRIFEKIGLTGKSIMPVILGFGCKTMATLVTRGLKSKKEKFIAVYLIAFAIPCSAQLAIDMAILGRIGFKAFLIAYGVLAFVEIAAGFILNKILKDDNKSCFIQELPAIRMPSLKVILTKVYYRLYWFLKEAVPIFISAAILLFLCEKTGILLAIKNLLRPIVVGWLGLPVNIVDVLILTLARHEAAAGLLLHMVDAGALTYIQCIVSVVITTMFVPCFANIVAMCKEMGTRRGILMAIIINISSFFLAGILNWILLFTIK